MVSDHENNNDASQLNDAALAHAERLVDQGVSTMHAARIHESGELPYIPRPHTVQDPPVAEKTRAVSHRGGRPFPEPSDSDLDPNWSIPSFHSSAAELESVIASRDSPARRAAAAAAIRATHNSVMRRTAGEGIVFQIAAERAAQERRERNQAS